MGVDIPTFLVLVVMVVLVQVMAAEEGRVALAQQQVAEVVLVLLRIFASLRGDP